MFDNLILVFHMLAVMQDLTVVLCALGSTTVEQPQATILHLVKELL